MSSWHPEYEISISDSEGEEDETSSSLYNGREAILFVVDANLYHTPDLLNEALNLIRSAFLSGLLVNDKDLMALILANTENSPEPFEPNCLDAIVMPDNCAVFLPPRQLNKAIVEHFLRFVETSPDVFGDVYGVVEGGDGNFSHMLRLCLDLVEHCNYSVNNSTIVYMTTKETPHSIQSEGFRQALQKAADLSGKQVEFQVIPMVDTFDYDVFYKEFMCLVRDIDMESFEKGNPTRLREILADRKLKQNFKRRSLGHFKLSLGPGLSLSAQYFNFYQKDKGPRKVLIRRADNAVVRRKRLIQVCKTDELTGVVGETRDINIKDAWYEINLGSSEIRLSYEQVNRVRNLHSPGMMLLGFKPRSEISKVIYCKPCNFMYPDDGHIVGSKRLFRALWERCRARDKVAICIFMCKRKSMPRYVALVPVAKDDADDNTYYTLLSNDGFKIVYLPCVSYIRNFDLSDWNSAENEVPYEGLDVCKKLVKKFRMKYNPGVLCDPQLDQLQSKLLALAFDCQFETMGSQYFPDPEQQDNRISSLIPQIQEIFGEDAEPIKKRSASTKTADTSTAPKLPKLSADKLDDKTYVMQMIANKTLGSCTKDQLLQILEKHFNRKVPKTTKKPDLLEHIYNN